MWSSRMSYQDPEEPKDVNDQDHAFDQWKLLGEESVKQDGDGCHGDDHKRCVPCFRRVVRIVQDNDALHLGSHQV